MLGIKKQFIQLALNSNALKFGPFTLKSGRKSPYFFNAGLIYRGPQLRLLGQLYAEALLAHDITFEHLFGPAYKGLPLATATAIALAEKNKDVSVTFNRKEVKEHGEGGQLIGAPLSGKTIIVDDVITAGTAFRESQRLILEAGGELSGVIIALDRCERGLNQASAIQDIKAEGIEVISLITIYDLLDYLKIQQEDKKLLQLEDYLREYGVR